MAQFNNQKSRLFTIKSIMKVFEKDETLKKNDNCEFYQKIMQLKLLELISINKQENVIQ